MGVEARGVWGLGLPGFGAYGFGVAQGLSFP